MLEHSNHFLGGGLKFPFQTPQTYPGDPKNRHVYEGNPFIIWEFLGGLFQGFEKLCFILPLFIWGKIPIFTNSF